MDFDISTLLDTNAALKKELEISKNAIVQLKIKNNELQNIISSLRVLR